MNATLQVYPGPGAQPTFPGVKSFPEIRSMPVSMGNPDTKQQWRFLKTGEKTYKIQAQWGGHYIAAGHPADPNAITHHDQSTDEWLFVDAPNNQYRIKSTRVNKYIAVAGSADARGDYGMRLVDSEDAGQTFVLVQQGDVP